MHYKRYIGVGLLLMLACKEDTRAVRPANAIVVGALLPFTGERAPLGVNVERMLLTLTDEINAAGGIDGRPLYVATYDTHSQTDRGRDEAENLLAEPGLLGVLGPEDPDLLSEVAPRFAQQKVSNLLPGIADTRAPTARASQYAFHLTPATLAVAGALAKVIRDGGHQTANIIYAKDAYNTQLAGLVTCELARVGITASQQAIGDDWNDNLNTLRQLAATDPQALLLIAYPKTGAQVITYWQLFASQAKWYLGPTLDTNEFVQNVPPGSLGNATGIAAALAWFAGAMGTRFQERWGDYPVTTAYYYYDALAALALAIQSAALAGPLTPDAIAEHLTRVTNPGGQPVGWINGQDNLVEGFEILRQGGTVNYEGLTGSFDIGSDGAIRQDLLRTWGVVEGAINYTQTPASYSEFLSSPCGATR